jgi:cellulase
MSCYQVKVSGSGTANPIAVKFPGAYKNTDAGILVSIYGNLNGYTVPGPPMYISGGSSTPVSSTNAPAVSSSTVRPVTSSTTARPATSTTVRTSSTAAPVPTSGATAAQYQQCGGTGFTGPSTCASPFKCVVLNPYYSQCQ